MAPADPTETHRLFQHERVAVGYASARPNLHPEVFARVRKMIGSGPRFRRGLDVGCGTGMSSVALLDLAEAVVGLDGSFEMLRHARRASGVSYVASLAELPPFSAGCFDIIVACGSIAWIDGSRFLPRVADLLASGGWLVSLDFADTGRSPEIPGLARWYDEVFRHRYPRPASRDPLITAASAAAHGFAAASPSHCDFVSGCSFTAARYADFLMSESNVIAAIEYGGEALAPLRASLIADLEPLFSGSPRQVAFTGHIQAFRRSPSR